MRHPHLAEPAAPGRFPGTQKRYSVMLRMEQDAMDSINRVVFKLADERNWFAYTSPLRWWPGLGCWAMLADNLKQPVLLSSNGMPERADAFEADQTVEVAVKLYIYESSFQSHRARGVKAQLVRVKLLGGFVRSVE